MSLRLVVNTVSRHGRRDLRPNCFLMDVDLHWFSSLKSTIATYTVTLYNALFVPLCRQVWRTSRVSSKLSISHDHLCERIDQWGAAVSFWKVISNIREGNSQRNVKKVHRPHHIRSSTSYYTWKYKYIRDRQYFRKDRPVVKFLDFPSPNHKFNNLERATWRWFVFYLSKLT